MSTFVISKAATKDPKMSFGTGTTLNPLKSSSKLSIRGLSSSHTIPMGLRFHDKVNRQIIFEVPPKLQTVDFYFDYKNFNAETKKAIVPTPWQVFIATYDNHGVLISNQVFWRSGPLKGFGSALGWGAFTNRDASSGGICMHSTARSANPNASFAHLMTMAYESVWSARFNYNITLPTSVLGHLNDLSKKHSRAYPEAFKGFSIYHNGSNDKIHSIFPTHGHELADVVAQYWPAAKSYWARSRPRNNADEHGDLVLESRYIALRDVLIDRADIEGPGNAFNLLKKRIMAAGDRGV